MSASILNPAPPSPATSALLSEHLHVFSDVDVIVSGHHFPAHRAVLSVHSLDFRAIFANAAQSDAKRFRVQVSVDAIDADILVQGWKLVYSFMYGKKVTLDPDAALAALPICRRYRFVELAAALDAYLVDGAVDVTNCTRVYSMGGGGGDAVVVASVAWTLMKEQFEKVEKWGRMPWSAMVRLLKLNDLSLTTEMSVFKAVSQWVEENEQVGEDSVAGLVKLVRFPTMKEEELERAAGSRLVKMFPVCRKYLSRGFAARADEKRGLIRSVVMESSPVYRRRRVDALTFSDRVMGWGRVDKTIQTSSRYFAGCLWNLVLEVGDEWVSLHLGCMAENNDEQVDVELDFSLFVVRHGGGDEPQLITKEVKRAGFGRSGQRIGFGRMIQRAEVEKEGSRLLLRDTLFIGASLRLRRSKEDVIGISDDGDDTAESVSTMG